MRNQLVERAMHGDQDAFASLAAENVDGCYRLAYRILRDPDRAHDATQQALLGAWRDLPNLRDAERLDRHCEEYFLEAVVPKGDRVYVFTLYEPNAPLDFSGMLDSIVLTPSTAKG